MIGPRSAYALLMAAIPIVLGGCFTYTPIQLDTAPVGHEVRVSLTRQEMAVILDADDLGLPEYGPPRLRGILTGRDESGLTIGIPIPTGQDYFLRSSIYRQIKVPSSSVVQLELRQLHRGRTVLAIASAVGGIAATLSFFILKDAGKPVPGGPVTDELNTLIPLFSFPVH